MASRSWNLQKKIGDLKFTVPAHVKPIRDEVLNFVEKECIPLERNITHSQYKALKQKAKDRGLWALGHPKKVGGQGMPFRDYMYVNEVVGRCPLAIGALGTHSLQDSIMLFNHATPEIQRKYLAPIVSGDMLSSFAMTEPNILSSDPTGIQTSAVVSPDGKNWIINGHKWFTTNASKADYTTVMCKTEFGPNVSKYERFSIILVPTNTRGYTVTRDTPTLGLTEGCESEVLYHNVTVPIANTIGERGKGFLISQERLGPGRIFHCMRWLGQMQRAFDLMCERLAQRKLSAEGKKTLGSLQLMQKHIFDSYCDISAHRLMVLFAAEKMDNGGYARIELAAAKAHGAQLLCRVMDRAVQVFGAKGLTDDTPLSRMYRTARFARFYDGADEVHMTTVGRLIHRQYKKGNRYDFSEGKFRSKL